MEDLRNFVPSGWKRDLLHIVGCHYACQITPLDSRRWEDDSHKFLWAMEDRKDREWLDIKEISPLQFMDYAAKVFKQVTDHHLKELSSHTGWIQAHGYYH